jgi:hypothetical protein
MTHRITRTTRRSRTIPPQYARTLSIDEMPRGGVRGGLLGSGLPSGARGVDAGIQGWQFPEPRVWRQVVMASGIKWRLATPAPRFKH